MDITDMDRINAVQQKLCEVKTWVDETLRILNYVCIDEAHKAYKEKEIVPGTISCMYNSSKADKIYPGQLAEQINDNDEIEECSS